MIFTVRFTTMLKTPAHFSPLLKAQNHPAPINFLFRGDELLVNADDLSLPSAEIAAWLGLPDERFHPVGQMADTYCQTLSLAKDTKVPEGFVFKKLRPMFGAMDDGLLAVAGRAFQISDWARTHRFCGACAAPTHQLPGERCMKCAACGHAAYPRISPAMMVLIRRGNQILLARHAASPAPFYTALAGFVEAGESVEEAVHREVYEEVGLRVGQLTYFSSQPWPFPHSLMIAFTAEYESGDIRIDPSEIADARWYGPGETLPLTPHSISIASSLIRAHLPA